jgi:hypothetical protein
VAKEGASGRPRNGLREGKEITLVGGQGRSLKKGQERSFREAKK